MESANRLSLHSASVDSVVLITAIASFSFKQELKPKNNINRNNFIREKIYKGRGCKNTL